MKIEICKSYRVLAHEKAPFYSLHPASDIYDRITVEVPDEMYTGQNAFGDPLVAIEGTTYTLDEVMTNWGDEPVLRWFDGQHRRWEKLAVVSKE